MPEPTEEPTEQTYYACVWCNQQIDEVVYDAGEVYEATDGTVCEECYENHGFDCRDCGDINHNDESIGVGFTHRQVCQSCYESEYFYCDGCDTAWSNDVYGGDGYCDDCYSDHDDEYDCDCENCGGSGGAGIRRWGDRPELNFWHRADDGNGYDYSGVPKAHTYYLGMEIELEDSRDVVGPVIDEVRDHMFATTDASLDTGGGVEIVTHPLTFEAWNNAFPWEWWKQHIHGAVPDQKVWNSNGIHIHVSRTAFFDKKAKPKASHLYKFMQFIQINQAGIQQLAGRNGNTYCRWDPSRDALSRLPDAKTNTSTDSYERYRPINTQNPDTIELRFFAGLSEPAFMKQCLQFVHSLVEFTRVGNFKSDRSWEAYARYVRRYAMRYPELAVYMNENSRELMVNAVSSEYNYTKTVMPDIKVLRKRAIADRIRTQAIEREREVERARIINNTPDCGCRYCERERNGTLGVPYPDQWYDELPNNTTPERIRERNRLITEAELPYRTVRVMYIEPSDARAYMEGTEDPPELMPIQEMQQLIALRSE